MSESLEGKAAGLAGEPRAAPYPPDTMSRSFWEAGWDSGDKQRRAEARKPKLTQEQLARDRVRKVGKGATINGTYRMSPEQALDAFRADLLRIVGE